jgi:hypothetical protein
VLLAGGSDNDGEPQNTAQLYDPVTGNFSSTGKMTVARDFHTATLLPDGHVLITGGRSGESAPYTYLASAEIYDPVAGVFTAVTGSMTASRYAHTAVLFNGKVLIAGGAGSAALASAELYDPAAGTFTSTGPLSTARQYFTATLIGSSVLEAGGLNSLGRLQSTEQYQGSGFLSAASMIAARAAHTATLLGDGSVLVIGGQGTDGISVATAELFKKP